MSRSDLSLARSQPKSVCLFALFLCAVVSIGSLPGCRDEAQSHKGVVEPRDPNVVAMIGDEAITKQNLDTALERLPQNRRERYRHRALDYLIEVRVFSEEARKAGLDKEPETQVALERAVNETLARHFIKKYVDQQAEPSEEEVKQFYLSHQDQFVVPEGVLIQHILVKKKEQAEAMLKELKEGASFEELAKKKSIARSWKKGGRLGRLYKGKMEPELEKVAFDLEKEKLSDVIRTKKGYQIIKVLDTSDKREIGFEEAKKRIRIALSGKERRKLVDQYYKAAKVNRDPVEEGVLVKVGDVAFTEEALAPIFARVSEEEREEIKRRWVRYFIETEVFSKEARKVKLESDPEVAVELQRKTDETLAKAFRQRFITDKFPINEEDIEGYYQTHQEEFRIPLRVRVESMLVETEAEAEEILRELKEGAAFERLAMKRSAPRARGIGWFGKGEKDRALEKVAFSLEKGRISGIIKTEAGYQIIKLMDKKGGEVRPLDEVKQAISMTLATQKFQHEKQRYYEKAKVKVFEWKGI